MKSFLLPTAIRTIRRFVGLFVCLILVAVAKGQTPTFSCYLTNEVRVSSTVYQFDIYLLSTGTDAFEYASGQWGITVNSAVVNGGTLTPSIVSSGVVNTAGTAVTWVSGDQFVTGGAWSSKPIQINGLNFTIN